MRRKSTIFLALGLIALILLYKGAEWYQGGAEQRETTSVYNNSSDGIHVFFELAQKIKPQSAEPFRKIFRKEDLDPSATLFILSPRKRIKDWEAKVLQGFVQEGGRLLLSFDDEDSFENLHTILSIFQAPQQIKKGENFKNYQTSEITASCGSGFFSPDETYSFYSRYWLDRPECQKGNFDCFAFEKQVGKGSVLLTAGLPLVGNALINRNANRFFAFRLIDQSPKLLLDEYHHFYSNHTMGQLLLQPRFALPFFSMIACVLLFFLFGHSHTEEVLKFEKAKPEAMSYHALNENILRGVLDQKTVYAGALSFHESYLEKNFPSSKTLIRANATKTDPRDSAAFLGLGLRWIRFHRHLLLQKRSLKKSA